MLKIETTAFPLHRPTLASRSYPYSRFLIPLVQLLFFHSLIPFRRWNSAADHH